MYATDDDDGQATFSISLVMKMIVVQESDLFSMAARTVAMEGC